MSKQTIGIGSAANDGTGDPLRTAFTKANANDAELYARTFPGYLGSSRWYIGRYLLGVNGAMGLNSIRFTPFFVFDTITVDQLGGIVTTGESGKSVQYAIYADNAATHRPTGTALASTGSISITSTGGISGAVNSSVPYQLTAGLYWFGRNSDTAGTGQTVNVATTTLEHGAIIGSATQANILAANGLGLTGYSFAQTFATWPDMTANTVSESNGSSGAPFPMYRTSSVP